MTKEQYFKDLASRYVRLLRKSDERYCVNIDKMIRECNSDGGDCDKCKVAYYIAIEDEIIDKYRNCELV